MVDSHQSHRSAHLWRLRLGISKNNQLSADRLTLWRLHTGSNFESRMTNLETLRLRFVLRSFVSSVCRSACAERVNRKVKDQAERVISTPELNTLLCLHPEPINVVVYHDPSGRTHLGIGLALRCFQRLSFPNIATQHCS